MKRPQITHAVALVAFILLAAHPSAAQICPGLAVERWDSGSVNGWQGGFGTVVTLIPTGGNLNGYLQLENQAQVQVMAAVPPWTGDWGAGGIRKISMDFQALGSGDGIVVPSLRIRRDAVTNGWIFTGSDSITIDGSWHSFAVPVNASWSDLEAEAAGWQVIPGTSEWSWAETMASVGYLIVIANNIDTGELVGLDNVEISCRLFSDGFESGDTLAWDSSVP